MKLTGLYGITDNKLLSDGKLFPYVEAALQGGMKLLQHRDKSQDSQRRYQEALALKKLCEQYQAHLIINDDLLLAKELSVGVHLGQEDSSIATARTLLGSHAIIGATCHDSLALAEQAKVEGASYLAFGRFFPSKTKPNAQPAHLNILTEAKSLGLPICAIGGINLDNITLLIEQHVDLFAVVNEIFAGNNTEQVKTNVLNFTKRINRH